MIRIDFPDRTTQGLIAVNVVFALIVTLQLVSPASPSNADEVALPDSDAALPQFGNTALNPPQLAHLADMLERPVFYDDRKLPAPPKDEAPPPPTPLLLKLEGVAIAGGSRVAVLRNLSNNLLLQLGEGGTHDGWTLESVGSNSASFSRGEQLTELTLDPGNDTLRR